MKNVPINQLSNHVGEEVLISGWVPTIRDQKRMQFLVLSDGQNKVQAVHEKTGSPLDTIISSLTPYSTVIATGEIIQNPDVKLNGYELTLNTIDVTSKAYASTPISEESALEQRLDMRWLDLRRPEAKLIFEVQTFIEHAMREYWIKNGFIEIHSPKLVPGASESGAELFQLDYFGQQASLAQSPQFYKQMAMAAGFGKVFEIGPVFRANPSFTTRHDTEFTMVDVEMSWINSHKDVMQFEENWLAYILERVKSQFGDKILQMYGQEIVVPKLPFPRVTMDEAQRLLKQIGYNNPKQVKGDLDPEGERRLAQHIMNEYGHEFVFVTDYPVSVRPFYHMREPETGLTRSFDLIWKGLEVTTGAQRENRYEQLLSQIKEKGIDPSSLGSYPDFFKYGCPPHGGYGFGLSRMLMLMFNLPSVREVTYIYRGPNRLTP